MPVLRLRFTHTVWEDPNEVEAEIQFDPSGPFVRVYDFMISAYECAHPEEYPDPWDDVPPIFATEFEAMLRVWGAVSEVVDLGGTITQRYANEPGTSRDSYMLKLNDRPCENDPQH